MRKSALLMLAAALPGCISISTYEQAMKKCRDQSVQLNQALAKNAELESTSGELERELFEKKQESDSLKNEISNVRGTYDELVQQLKDNIAKGDVSVRQTAAGLTVTMGNQILFHSGRAELQPLGKGVLMQVAGVIGKVDDKLIQVEGHTDNLRIAGALKTRFPSNWELSSARAASVVRFLQEAGGIPAERLVLAAHAETRPIADNNTPEGRRQNRRVEIVLVPRPE